MSLIFILLALVISITLHEFAHAWTGNYLGDNTAQMQGRLTLDPRAHIDPVMTILMPLFLIVLHSPVIFGAARPVPFNPWAVRGGKWGAAAVAAAGPATNLLIAAFCAVWIRFVPHLPAYGLELLVDLVTINAAFCIFNLIPFPPLDGSRLLYAVAPAPLRAVMDRIERAGLAAVFLLLFVAYPVLAPFIARIVQALVGLLIPGVTQL